MSSSMDPATLPPRPPALKISKTCVYKTIPPTQTSISVDLYYPFTSRSQNTTSSQSPSIHQTGILKQTQNASPILLFIHGGGWIGGNRTDYSRPMFHEFLALGFVVVSMDYRLLPESTFAEQQEDIRDIEPWLKTQLPIELERTAYKVDTSKIVVAAASAGAHLALLIPKLWHQNPSAILAMYAPTNFHHIPWLNKGRLARLHCKPCTPSLLAAATFYSSPPTYRPLPSTPLDYQKPRQFISLTFFREATVAEFLLRGLVRVNDGDGDGDGELGEGLKMPEKGCVGKKEVDAISPLQLAERYVYPPVYMAIGDADELFGVSHAWDFHAVLEGQGVPVQTKIVQGATHAFDVREDIGSKCHRDVLIPAVHWVAKFVGVGTPATQPDLGEQ